MAIRYLLTESATGRFMGLFKEFDGAHAYAQNRMKTKTRKGEEKTYFGTTPKKDPVPKEEWSKHYLYRVDEVEVE